MTSTKVSKVTAREVAEYIRVDASIEELQAIEVMLTAAKSYIKNYTALTATEMDEYPDLVLALMVICQDFYDNRAMYGNAGLSPNKTVQCILDMHVRCGVVGSD